MPSVTEDTIKIVITADASGADKAFDDSMKRLSELESRVTGMSGKLSGFGSGLAQGLAPALTALSNLADKASSLDGFEKRLTGVADGIGNLSKVTGTESAAAGRTVSQLASSIGSLESLDGNRLDALANGLDKIPEAVRNLSNTGTDQITDLKDKLDALADASREASKVGNGIAGLGQGLKNIPTGIREMAGLRDYDSLMSTLGTRLTSLAETVDVFSESSQRSVRSIRSLAEALRMLAGTDPEKLTNGLSEASTALKGFVSDLNGWAGENDISQFLDLANAVNQVSEAYDKLAAARSAVSGGAGSAGAVPGAGQATSLMSVLQGVGGAFGKTISTGWDVATRAAQGYLSVMQRIVSVPIDSVRAGIDNVTHSVSRLFSMAASAVFYNALFSGLRAATDGVTAGIQNLYQWALIMGNGFVGTMDSCATSLLYFQNSIGGAASELLDALAPALETIVNYAVAALNAINQLLAALTGHSTWRRARRAQTQFATAATGAADASQDAADSASNNADATDDATKAEKRYENTVLGFDELNKLNDTNDDSGSKGRKGAKGRTPSGAGGGAANPDYGSMFEDVPIDQRFKDLANTDDWTKLGQQIADALNGWEKSIDWDSIDKTAAKWSKRVWTAFNGFVGERDWSSFGYTIARGLNVGLHFIDDIAQHADFTGFGAGIAGALNKAVETLDWAALGRVMTDKLKVQLEFLHGFLNGSNGNDTYAKFNFDALRDRLNVAIDAAFGNINWQQAVTDVTDGIGQVGLTLVSGVSRIAHDLDDAVQHTDWVGWGAQVAGYLNQAVQTIDWGAVGRVLTDGLKVAFEGLHGALQEFDWAGLGNGIETAITEAFNNIDWAQAGTDINSLANHLLDVVEQALAAINWDDVNTFIKNMNIPQLLLRALCDIAVQLGQLVTNCLENGTWPIIMAWLIGKFALSNFKQVLSSATVTGGQIGQAFGASIGVAISFDGIRQECQDGFSLGSFSEVVGGAALTGASVGGAFGHPVLGAVIGACAGVIEQLVQNGPEILQHAQEAFGGAGDAIKSAWDTGWQNTKDFFSNLTSAFSNLPQDLKDGWDSTVDNLKGCFTGFLDWLKNLFSPTPAQAKETGEDTGQGYADGVDSKQGDAQNAGQSLGQRVKDAIGGFVSGATSWGSSLGSNVGSGISGITSWVGDRASSLGERVRSSITSITGKASSWGRSAGNDLGSGMEGARSTVSGAAQYIAGVIRSQLAYLRAGSWGRDMMSNLANGIWNGVRGVQNAVIHVSNLIASYLHFSVPDVGPLADFDTYGPDMMRELATGIDRYRYLVTDSVGRVAGGMAGQLAIDGKDATIDATASIANAVTLGVVGSQPQQGQQQDRPITLVLRIGDEDIARATYRGIDSLASRGVITPEFV